MSPAHAQVGDEILPPACTVQFLGTGWQWVWLGSTNPARVNKLSCAFQPAGTETWLLPMGDTLCSVTVQCHQNVTAFFMWWKLPVWAVASSAYAPWDPLLGWASNLSSVSSLSTAPSSLSSDLGSILGSVLGLNPELCPWSQASSRSSAALFSSRRPLLFQNFCLHSL